MEFFIPSGIDETEALRRTTHLAVSAHHDDIEFMAYDGILKCFKAPGMYFAAAVVSNGSGSPRSGIYGDFSDEEMISARIEEQKKAAVIGEYTAQAFLGYPSSVIKDSSSSAPIEDLEELIRKTEPNIIYTHNLADKHDTHTAVALRLIEALRRLDYIPEKLYGCEVWRGLDWMCDDEKTAFNVGGRQNLENALLGVFDSQIAGGKRYDSAVIGRRLANATFSESHSVDKSSEVIFAMDMTPLVKDKKLSPSEYVGDCINRFKDDVTNRIEKFI